MNIAITSSGFSFFSFFGFTRESLLCPLFCGIYINNLSNQIVSTVKHFFIARNAKISTDELNSYLKSDSHLPKKICFTCLNENPSKMMKNAFYLILKARFVLKIFKFLLNGLIREIRLISRFMTSHPG